MIQDAGRLILGARTGHRDTCGQQVVLDVTNGHVCPLPSNMSSTLSWASQISRTQMCRTFISPASPHRLGNGSGKNVSCFPACGHVSHVCVSSVNDLVTWQWQRGSAFAWMNMQWNVTLIEATSSMCLIFLPVTHSDHVLGKPTTWASNTTDIANKVRK